MKCLRVLGGIAAALTFACEDAWSGTIYAIDFKINNAASYDSVDFRVNYSAANGDFVGVNENVQCTTNASLNVTASYYDADPSLNAGLMKTTVFQAPVVLVTCNFDATGAKPTANQFVITVRDRTPKTSPTPTVIISRIQ